MNHQAVQRVSGDEFPLWRKQAGRNIPHSFVLELTARCVNDCGHCYIRLPAGDEAARRAELTLTEIRDIAGQAAGLGALNCLLTGGEPLLRPDFPDVYLSLKRKGLFVSLYTTGNIVTDEHLKLLRRYPPLVIEVTVYGVTRETHERVTGVPGSFEAFCRGLDRLLAAGLRVRLKAMALRSNLRELPEIASFCRERTCDYFRFDPLLHLRFDGDPVRNERIRRERLSPSEIAELEHADPERREALERSCSELIFSNCVENACTHLFHCGAGQGKFEVGYDGRFRLCSALCHPDCTYDLRRGALADAWNNLVPKVRALRSERTEFLTGCRSCPIVNLCLWCPAHAHLETGELDAPVPYFCEVAHARAAALRQAVAAKEKE